MSLMSEPLSSSLAASVRVNYSDHSQLLSRGLSGLLKSGERSDLEIRCGQRVFRVHKLVLSIFTDYFDDTDGLWLNINVAPRTMEQMLSFLYTGHVTMHFEEMDAFLDLCRALKIKLFLQEKKEKSGAGEQQGQTEGDEQGAEEVELNKEETLDNEQRQLDVYELSDFHLLCRRCYKVFGDEKSLRKHTWLCLREPTFKCLYCPKAFRIRNDLENHTRSRHTKEKPFVCDYCNRAFAVKTTWRQHVRERHENYTYVCDFPDCNATFKTKNTLAIHRHTQHTTIRPVACNDCGDCFPTRTALRKHMTYCHRFIKSRKDEALGSVVGSKAKWSKKYMRGLDVLPDEQIDGDIQKKDTNTVVCPLCQLSMVKPKFSSHFKKAHPESNYLEYRDRILDRRRVADEMYCPLCQRIVGVKWMTKHYKRWHSETSWIKFQQLAKEEPRNKRVLRLFEECCVIDETDEKTTSTKTPAGDCKTSSGIKTEMVTQSSDV